MKRSKVLILSLLGAFSICATFNTAMPANKGEPGKGHDQFSKINTNYSASSLHSDFNLALAPLEVRFERPSTGFIRVPDAILRKVNYTPDAVAKANSPPVRS